MIEDYPKTLLELEQRFATDEQCRAYLATIRWPEGFVCPSCGGRKAWPAQRGRLICAACRHQATVTAGTIFQDSRLPLQLWCRALWQVTSQKNGASALGLQRVLGLGSYRRIRMARIPDGSADHLHRFIQSAIVQRSCVHTDGWKPYQGLDQLGYQHEVSKLKGQKKSAATELLPRVHRVASLLKRWLLGTHQGAIAPEHLDYYLDEFTFRFNRRTSASRGKLFYRLAQQAVQVPPVPYQMLVGGANNPRHHQ